MKKYKFKEPEIMGRKHIIYVFYPLFLIKQSI